MTRAITLITDRAGEHFLSGFIDITAARWFDTR
jgi:hypothetical protein